MTAMNRGTSLAVFLSRSRHFTALGLGLFLGQAVTLMAQRHEASWWGFGVSTLFVASAAASFVLFILGQQRGPVPGAVRSRQAHNLVGVIGVSLLLSLRATDFLV
jgi:uncharacterized membrane protein